MSPTRTGRAAGRKPLQPSSARPAPRARAARPHHKGAVVLVPGRLPSWLPWATLATGLLGTAIAAYLTIVHYVAPASLYCSDTGAINCTKVTTSAESAILGVPVALIGLVYFAAMSLACSPKAWRSGPSWLRPARVVAAAGSIAFVLYLIYTELFVVFAICLWCTAVHVTAFALFVLVAFGTVSSMPAAAPRPRR
ncbi:MAG: vitamin K epoxide reductase family protein [Acidimicrobiales bacterium]